MKLTKFKHACFTLEKHGQVLVVDPGSYSDDLVVTDNIVGVVCTHKHTDHADAQLINKIQKQNPDAPLIAHQSVIDELGLQPSRAVISGDVVTIGAFKIEFFGDLHAEIHPDIPRDPNLGVLINSEVCYSGDSFSAPSGNPSTLLLPVAGNWMKIRDAIELLEKIRPARFVPTHDAPLSELGKQTVAKWLQIFAIKYQAKYIEANREIDVDG